MAYEGRSDGAGLEKSDAESQGAESSSWSLRTHFNSRCPSTDQYLSTGDFIGERDRALFLFSLDTGARARVACNMNIKDET